MKKKLFLKFFVFAVIAAFVTVTSCKDYDDDISQLNSELSTVKTDYASKIDALKTELNSAMDTKINAANTEITALKAKVATLEANAATQADIDAAKAEILGKVIALEVFNTFKTTTETELTALKADLAKAATKEALEGVEAALTSKLGELSGQLDAMGLRVDKLESDYAALLQQHDDDVADLIQRIADAKAELKLDIAALETALEAAEGRLDGRIDSLDTELKEMLADQLLLIEANADAITDVAEDLQSKYDELVAVDEDLQNQITVNAGDIKTINDYIEDTLKPQLTTINNAINTINETTIPELENRLNLKISNLFTVVTNRLSSISLASNAYVGGIEAIEFTSLIYKPMESGENAVIPTSGYNFSTAAPSVASYKFNPRSFKLSNADYKYVDRQATVRSTTASGLVVIEGEPSKKDADGTVNFTLRRQNAHSNKASDNSSTKNFIQLEATLKGNAVDTDETDVVVAAEQQLVFDNILNAGNVRIADKATLATAGNDAHYPVTFNAAKEGKIWYEMPYDKVYDLLAKVATCANDGNTHAAFDIDAYNLSYKFAVASSVYNITEGGTETNQQDWVELVNAEEGTYQAKNFNKELIGRTPILKVELVDQAGNVVRRAFVKVKFVAEKTADITVGETHSLKYQCDETEAEFTITEQYIRDNVYRIITSGKETSMSHEEFWNTYDAETATGKVLKNGVSLSMNTPEIVSGATGDGTATKKIVWSFMHSEIGTIGVGGSQLVGSVTVKNKLVSSEFPEYVTFQFTVNVTLPNVNLPAANKVENDTYWSKDADGNYVAYQVNINVPESTTSPASEAQFRTSLPQAYTKYDVVHDGACVESYYKIVDTYSNGVRDVTSSGASDPLAGVGIDENDITLEKTGANAVAVKTALNSRGGLQASVAHIYELETGEKITVNTFLVNFIRPVNLNMPDGVTVKDAQDDGDIADFQWNGILTDWRGHSIVAPEGWTSVERNRSFWKYVYETEYEYQPEYQKLVTDASLDVVMAEASFTIGATPVTLYRGTATYQVQKRTWRLLSGWGDWTNEGSASVLLSEQMLTEDQVNAWLALKLTELEADLSWEPLTEYQIVEVSAPVVTPETVTGEGQVVEYSYVESVTYTPAVYETVPGTFIAVPHTPTARPTFDGTENGQVVGDWMWTTRTWNNWVWVPGQYWRYYGPFGDITADFANVTTNLTYNDNKLPSHVTLEQVGNTVKYVNVGAPIAYAYEIYIPVSVNYGWGTVSTQLTIKVDPVN